MEISDVKPSKSDTSTKQCKNCNTEFSGTFCSDCGQKYITERITVRSIFSELWVSLTNLEKGFWYTFKMLFVNPGTVVRDFISGRTVQYYPPLRYMILWVAVSVAISLSTGLYDQQQATIQDIAVTSARPEVAEMQRQMQQQIQAEARKYLNFMPLIILPFMALASFLVFRRRGQNYAEHLILNAYAYSQMTAIGIVFLLLALIFPGLTPYLMLKVLLLNIVYYTHMYRGFFQIRIGNAFFKALWTTLIGYLGGFLFFAIVGIVVGIFIALKMKGG